MDNKEKITLPKDNGSSDTTFKFPHPDKAFSGTPIDYDSIEVIEGKFSDPYHDELKRKAREKGL